MSDVVSGFTFHNVSINSKEWPEIEICTAVFTFHNVSINSKTLTDVVNANQHLHSIMYLLIQRGKLEKNCTKCIYIP